MVVVPIAAWIRIGWGDGESCMQGDQLSLAYRKPIGPALRGRPQRHCGIVPVELFLDTLAFRVLLSVIRAW